MPNPEAPAALDGLLPAPRRPLLLVLSLLLAGVLGLMMHMPMLAPGAPLPASDAPLWARWIDLSIVVGGILLFLRLASPRLEPLGDAKRICLVFMILAMLQEPLRAAIMAAFTTEGWQHSATAMAGPVIRALMLAWLGVYALHWVRGATSLIVIALIAGGLGTAFDLLSSPVVMSIMKHLEAAPRAALYSSPVTAAAYVSFYEAVGGATLMTMVLWDQLPGGQATRVLVLALLAALLKGVVGGTFIHDFLAGPSAVAAVSVWGRFLLDFVALGLMVGLCWAAFGQRRLASLPRPQP